MKERAQSCLIALRRILRVTEMNERALARQSGVTTPQLIVMQIVADAGEATLKTIAGRAGVGQATATALIDRLEARGFAKRERGSTDRRQVFVSLTAAGRAALEAAPDPLHARFVSRFESLPEWEQAMLVAALERTAGLLDASELDASPVLHAGAIDQPPGTGEPR